MRIWSSWFYPHFDNIHAICHRHWEQASPPSVWLGSEITTLLTEEQKKQNMTTCENICLTSLGKMCLSQPAKHFMFWSSENKNNSDSVCYSKKSTGRQTMQGLVSGDDMQHSISETTTVSKMFFKTLTEGFKLDRERQQRNNLPQSLLLFNVLVCVKTSRKVKRNLSDLSGIPKRQLLKLTDTKLNYR